MKILELVRDYFKERGYKAEIHNKSLCLKFDNRDVWINNCLLEHEKVGIPFFNAAASAPLPNCRTAIVSSSWLSSKMEVSTTLVSLIFYKV